MEVSPAAGGGAVTSEGKGGGAGAVVADGADVEAGVVSAGDEATGSSSTAAAGLETAPSKFKSCSGGKLARGGKLCGAGGKDFTTATPAGPAGASSTTSGVVCSGATVKGGGAGEVPTEDAVVEDVVPAGGGAF